MIHHAPKRALRSISRSIAGCSSWPYDQSPVKNRRFEIVRGDGTKVRGVTDAQGKTGLQKSLFIENTSLRILPE